ncbi:MULTISPECIES: hypothetical protein [Methylomonas]|uniref:Rhombotarget lipoprotein n=2 Tax=Methylomonas TaxID=416 RepID=A0A140E404_9GAMM|nr:MULTISPECIES: hypothetical protein [Methylomonas]AMK75128.1 hypothetical protein JT25_001285 [Methylomonas denitrificans]OAI02617.1 hypothetical protein A1342_02275 [Methylomonas methanica]TCV83056.1 rhombotail lipoprotein [Methylomonas methanica]
MKKIWIFTLTALLAACSATDLRPHLEQSIEDIPKTQFSTAKTVEEVRKLRPQATIPLKIAVVPASRHRMEISKEEQEAIKSWGEKFRDLGFVKSFEIIPQSLISNCGYKSEGGCFLNESRLAGARMGADAILFINDNTGTDSYLNPLSMLNISIVGMWLVPGHHRDSYSVYEASLLDINNGYLYGFAEDSGEYKAIRPFMYANRNTGQNEARLEALNKVFQKLYTVAEEYMHKGVSLNK